LYVHLADIPETIDLGFLKQVRNLDRIGKKPLAGCGQRYASSSTMKDGSLRDLQLPLRVGHECLGLFCQIFRFGVYLPELTVPCDALPRAR
jgi:hypothetical protein